MSREEYQPPSLSGVRFGSQAIQFLGENDGAKYFCMEQSVFDYGANWLLSTVAFFATKFVIRFHASQSGFFLWNQGR